MTKPKTPQISLRPQVYEKLRSYCRKSGEQMGTVADALVRKFLDEQEGKN